jgi:mRNA interferase MazF
MGVIKYDKICQGDIVIVKLDRAVGKEMQKTRPCLVVSPDGMNNALKTCIIAPLTSKSKPFPTRIPSFFNKEGGAFALDQIRTIDLQRILSIAGKIDKKTLNRVKSCLLEMFA